MFLRMDLNENKEGSLKRLINRRREMEIMRKGPVHFTVLQGATFVLPILPVGKCGPALHVLDAAAGWLQDAVDSILSNIAHIPGALSP